MQGILDYEQGCNILKVIDKAKEACENSEQLVSDHFAEVSKMVELGSGAKREIDDLELSRYACYLIVQNADPKRKGVRWETSSAKKHSFGGQFKGFGNARC